MLPAAKRSHQPHHSPRVCQPQRYSSPTATASLPPHCDPGGLNDSAFPNYRSQNDSYKGNPSNNKSDNPLRGSTIVLFLGRRWGSPARGSRGHISRGRSSRRRLGCLRRCLSSIRGRRGPSWGHALRVARRQAPIGASNPDAVLTEVCGGLAFARGDSHLHAVDDDVVLVRLGGATGDAVAISAETAARARVGDDCAGICVGFQDVDASEAALTPQVGDYPSLRPCGG